MRLFQILFLSWLTTLLPAQEVVIKAQGGGDLKIGANSYQFTLEAFYTAPPKGGLPGAVKFSGLLSAKDGSAPFHMDLSVLKNGTLYMLTIQRRNGRSYPDSWNATQKTKTRFLKLEDRPGGRFELRCEGMLTGVISQKPAQANWSGTLWAVQPGSQN
ncbi:MAG TPA: hypothetical protein VJ486_14225 [Geothrix sp.]|nr:hypothetical protein [Geothrix sp.]